VGDGEVKMEPGWSSELLLRLYDLYLLCLAVVLGGFAVFSLVAYFAFLFSECLRESHFQKRASPTPAEGCTAHLTAFSK
jgi:hypothetical protein